MYKKNKTFIFISIACFAIMINTISICMTNEIISDREMILINEIDEIKKVTEANCDQIEILNKKINDTDTYEETIQKMNSEINELYLIEDLEEWFLTYKRIMFKYSYINGIPKGVWDDFSYNDMQLLLSCVETECYGQSFESKIHVANVIFNRFESGNYGDTIGEVITAENQFSYHKNRISESTILAVEYAYEIRDLTNGCLSFHSNEKTDKFCGKSYVFSDDAGHHFYK